jgi:hypothetical protein
VKEIIVAAAVALIAGCSAASPPALAPVPTTDAVAAREIASVPDRGVSWMTPEAAKSALLYVSDLGTFDVDVYTLPSRKRSGKLTGFDEPQGECTDPKGNVWVTNTGAFQIVKYAHGGTKPAAILNDPLGYPVGCAIDPASGNLAVANLKGLSGAGLVLVYEHARGTPAAFADLKQYSCFFAAYDAKGDLYVSGETGPQVHSYVLSVLPHHSTSMSTVTISGGTLYFPGTVAWVGSTLVLGDQKCRNHAASCFYELKVSGKKAKITHTTPLAGACDVAQAWVGKKHIAGGDYRYCGGRSSVDIWPYPSGGVPSAKVTGLQMPVGTALSP